MFMDFGTHACAGVADSNHYVAAGLDPTMRFKIGGVKDDIGGFEDQSASFQHGVPRIDGEVDDDLFD